MKLRLLCLLLVSAVYAGPGKIAGTVVDENGDGIIGASVLIVETSQGVSILNPDGSYVILGVAPGVYTLKVESIGYGRQQFKEVEVAFDRTTTLNATLLEETIQGAETLIVYTKPVVKLGPGIVICGPRRPSYKLAPQFRVAPRHRHYLTQPSGRDVF
jgi:hypothetical protein